MVRNTARVATSDKLIESFWLVASRQDIHEVVFLSVRLACSVAERRTSVTAEVLSRYNVIAPRLRMSTAAALSRKLRQTSQLKSFPMLSPSSSARRPAARRPTLSDHSVPRRAFPARFYCWSTTKTGRSRPGTRPPRGSSCRRGGAGGRRRQDHRDRDREDSESDETRGKRGNVPTWLETVELLVDANIENHKNSKGGGGGRGAQARHSPHV